MKYFGSLILAYINYRFPNVNISYEVREESSVYPTNQDCNQELSDGLPADKEVHV